MKFHEGFLNTLDDHKDGICPENLFYQRYRRGQLRCKKCGYKSLGIFREHIKLHEQITSSNQRQSP